MQEQIPNVFFEGQVLWSQIDANQHLRHSAYADFGTQARLGMMEAFGAGVRELLGQHIGPVLFREELTYLREVALGETLRVTSEILSARPDGSRWSIRHRIYRSDGVNAAIIIVDGAWLDTLQRRLVALPESLNTAFHQAPKAPDFTVSIPAESSIKPTK